jgi:predicted O-linked N-acetylglucosamine transferase (SPINDLY family)
MNSAPPARLLQTALAHHTKGRLAEAERFYRQILVSVPRNFDALHLLGTLLYQKGRYPESLDFLSRAHQVNPTHGICEMRLGLALAALQRLPEAERHLRAATRREPKSPDTWNNLAATLRALGRFKEAADCLRQSIALKPDAHEIHDQLGGLLADTEGLPAGLPHFKRAVELQPAFAQGWCNLGLALIGERRHAEALEALDRALVLDPALQHALVGRALALQETYRLAEAMDAFGRVLARIPAHHEARSGRLLTLNYLSGISRDEGFAEHLAFGHAAEEAAAPPAARPRPHRPGDRLRLAFLSPDLRNHSVAYFLEPLLRHLDRSRFEVILYHDHFQIDAMSDRLRGLADLWRNFIGQRSAVVESAIRADAPDILVDLAGHTGRNRLPLFAHRLAPIQVTYLGYPNTTGLRAMDFRFVDAITDPDDEDQRYHTERLIRFSNCAWAYQPPPNAPEPSRDAGPGITFGSFNNLAKLSPGTLALWARLLATVPDSHLLLKGHGLHDPALRGAMEQKLRDAGFDLARVELLGRRPDTASHLEIYRQVDVALDPFPYHGTTTTCEALWMGVPVISLRGDRHASRVGASLLTAAGHPEWITETADDYVRVAAETARERAARPDARSQLRRDLQASVLLDHAGQSQRFAAALLRCWELRPE